MAVLGRPDFASYARGFKLEGKTMTHTDQFAAAFARYQQVSRVAVWNIHISDQVTSPSGRKMPE